MCLIQHLKIRCFHIKIQISSILKKKKNSRSGNVISNFASKYSARVGPQLPFTENSSSSWPQSPFISCRLLHCIYQPSLCCSVTQLCLTLCDPMDCSKPGSSVQGISQQVYLSAGHKRNHIVSLNLKKYTLTGSNSAWCFFGLGLLWPKVVDQWDLRAGHLYSLEILRNLQARMNSL